jgi:alpha-terpineol hydroxylase
MSIVDTNQDTRIPDDVAKAIIDPLSYGDEQGIVYPAFTWLRNNMPLGQARLDDWDPLWLVCKYDDIMKVELEPTLFNATENNPILQTRPGDEFIKSMNGGSTRLMDAFPFMDPPEHTRMRRTTGNWFLPRNVQRFEDQMRRIAREDVEKLLSYDDEFDWMQDFAADFPLRVVMSLFGMPLEDMPFMKKVTQEFFGPADPDVTSPMDEMPPDQAARAFQQAILSAYEWFHGFIVDRRENPQDDLLSMIANAKTEDGELLPESFVSGQYMQLATASHDTTSTSMTGVAMAASRHPEQWDAVRADHSLIKNLVEESVRWMSPVKHFCRTASEDTEIRGVKISKGDRLMLNYPSGNRDEEYFDNADQFDLHRSPNKHLGFGYGAHGCIGLHIARQEMRVLWEELLPHVKKIELTGEPNPVKTNFVSSFKSCPVKITKA